MAEEKPGIHVDSDWKKQAQEEKRRLAEQEQQRKASAEPAGPVGVVPGAATGGGKSPAEGGRTGRGGRGQRSLPPAGFGTLVQSLATQVLFYLGEIGQRGMEPSVDLDMARHNLDTMAMLEEKTKGNLTPDEQAMLDGALYEARMRFISVSSQYAQLP